ncbi:MAG: serine/threonine protein kinase [Kofleriaceae bacterium]
MKLCPKCQKQFSDDANFCPVDAARLVPAEGGTGDGVPSSLSAKYQLGASLGGSRTGTVYRANDKQSGAPVAVKIIARSVVALPGVAQRLERELKQLERVHSAGVAKVLGSGKHEEDTWVAYELLEGAQTLAEAISARGPIPLDQAAHLIEVVGEALIEAAQVGVVHRDLAPKNVLFAGDEIKLINFSLPVPTSDRVPGVPEFVAPEQVEGKPVDQRSNLYSLGALYYYVLTGQTVHGGSPDEVHRAHVNGMIRTPSSLAPVPGPVEAVIMRALDRSPTKRFLTVRQFVDEVGRVARGEADPRSTLPMGKVGRPKAELVQTLLGMRSGPAGVPVISPPVGSGPSAPTLGGVPALAVSPGSVPTTMAGVASAPIATGAPASAPIASPVDAAAAPGSVGTPTPPLQAPSMAAPVAVAAPSPIAAAASEPTSLPPPERSPWAPPSTVPPAAEVAPPVVAAAPAPAAPVVAPPVVAPPVVAPPVVAAPVVAPPQVANAPSGKKGKSGGGDDSKGKFRETMWFKKGDLDAQAAADAAEERAKTGRDAATDKADTLPIDERYKDDGSISRGDKEKYSLRTGGTQMMSAMKDPGASVSSSRVSEDALIGEMKRGRGKVLVAIGLGVAVLVALILVLAR